MVNTFPRQRKHATIELLDACVCGSWIRGGLLQPLHLNQQWSIVLRLWVFLYIHLSLLGSNSEQTFPRQWRIVGGVVFYAVRVVSKENRQFFTELLVGNYDSYWTSHSCKTFLTKKNYRRIESISHCSTLRKIRNRNRLIWMDVIRPNSVVQRDVCKRIKIDAFGLRL
jgi:hypothetical protein